MNQVILIGRLTRDPEVKSTQSGTKIAKYTLAVDGSKDAVNFIPCTAFGRQAEFAEKYFRQGLKIGVVGKIQTGSYTNRDGQKVNTTDIIVDNQEFVESKKAESDIPVRQEVPEDGRFHRIPDIPENIDMELPFE